MTLKKGRRVIREQVLLALPCPPSAPSPRTLLTICCSGGGGRQPRGGPGSERRPRGGRLSSGAPASSAACDSSCPHQRRPSRGGRPGHSCSRWGCTPWRPPGPTSPGQEAEMRGRRNRVLTVPFLNDSRFGLTAWPLCPHPY